MGHEIIQLHPLDVGVLLELDAFLPRDAWFWDDLPAARAAHAARTAKADDIVAVDVAVDPEAGPRDPVTMAATWAAIVGIEPPVTTADGAALALGRRAIRFVPARGGRTGIVAVDMHATDREHGTGRHGELCNTLIRFV